MSKGTLRQILLLTDGCSNSGEDPVAIAALAKEEGMTVNVIGIVDNGDLGEQGISEVESIASAGGGISQIVYAKQLSQTVQMVTRKAMTQTIQGVVNKEISQILGEGKELEDLEPEKRGQLMEVVDELGETMDLDLLILVDTSASMKNKLPMVQEALIDLSVSLRSRTGNNNFALYSFPGKRKDVDKLIQWTPQFDSLSGAFKKMTISGITPTGPALQEAIRLVRKRMKKRGSDSDERFDLEEAGM
ncbi:Ca-activated chloride channel family protein [Evansella vedderi]|uniref:Ca-activated chloride channel family protein n=1 Tax=Evansella vedderi TaxID=38282 RepID=A0ABU0A6B5_9BACI|nr:VWA domain-containing protein [Evansella vedderi]MDQ0257875.1 Ca-activated chloride channel family protein [Evansella vedderi]